MEPRKGAKETASPAAAAGPAPLEKLLAELVGALPALDGRSFNEALEEARQHPRAALRFLFQVFGEKDPARRAVAARLLAAIGSADVRDNLNGLIVDAGVDEWTKVLAGDLLAELGSPVDADIFAMSVPGAEPLRAKLPSRTLALLASGDAAGALKHIQTLSPADHWLMIHRAVAERKEAALPMLETLARETEADAVATVSAIAREKFAAGVPLLLELQRDADKELQKLIKKALFDMRIAGVDVPAEDKLQPPAPVAGEAAAEGGDENLPLYRALVSEPSSQGLILVTVARVRPNGRLKVFSVLVELWKRGIRQAAVRMTMSKSSFDRFVEAQGGEKLRMKSATIEECRRVVARGVRVAREFGSPLPFDFGVGRTVLGNIEREIAELATPFLCSHCGKPLDAETVEKIRAVAPYDNMPAETRCLDCRKPV